MQQLARARGSDRQRSGNFVARSIESPLVKTLRLDAINFCFYDRQLRDNPLATKDDHWWVQMYGQRSVYNACLPEVHDVLRRWRVLADTYQPPRILLGETYVLDVSSMGRFYGQGDELHLAFNFTYVHAPFQASEKAGGEAFAGSDVGAAAGSGTPALRNA